MAACICCSQEKDQGTYKDCVEGLTSRKKHALHCTVADFLNLALQLLHYGTILCSQDKTIIKEGFLGHNSINIKYTLKSISFFIVSFFSYFTLAVFM